MAWTKEQRAEYMKRYRAEHKEQIRANNKYYYDHHREECRKKQREYYAKRKSDPEYIASIKASQKKWREKNREKVNAYQRERNRAIYRAGRKALYEACSSSADCSACEYAYHDNGFNECAVDGVKPLERKEA